MPYKNYEDMLRHSREYYRAHREHYLQLYRNHYAKNREQLRAIAREYYKNNRLKELKRHDRYYADPVSRKKSIQSTMRWRAYAKACRQELRALVEQFPAVVKTLDIDLERATDGQVRQFYDNLMEDIANGNFFDQRKRKRQTKATKTAR